jgi:hypothetical protein
LQIGGVVYNKFKSRRFWIAMWATVNVTIIMHYALWKSLDLSWMTSVMSFLLGIIGAYVGIESWNKPKMKG